LKHNNFESPTLWNYYNLFLNLTSIFLILEIPKIHSLKLYSISKRKYNLGVHKKYEYDNHSNKICNLLYPRKCSSRKPWTNQDDNEKSMILKCKIENEIK